MRVLVHVFTGACMSVLVHVCTGVFELMQQYWNIPLLSEMDVSFPSIDLHVAIVIPHSPLIVYPITKFT